MRRMTDEIVPMLNKLWQKGQGLISRLLNATDHTITKLSFLVEDKLVELDRYMKDRRKLMNDIHEKQTQIENLQAEITRINNSKTERLMLLYELLAEKNSELIATQRKYFMLEKNITEYRNKLNALTLEKAESIRERNSLRNEYDNLQQIVQANIDKITTLNKELNELKKKQYHSENTVFVQQEIDKKNREIDKLKEENKNYHTQMSQIEQQLLEKAKEIAKLNIELQKAEVELNDKKAKIIQLNQIITQKSNEVEIHKAQLHKQKEEIEVAWNFASEYEQQLITLQKEKKILEKELLEQEEEFTINIANYEAQIKHYQAELDEKIDYLAIEKVNNNESSMLSREQEEILQQEYEPRFRVLYKNSVFHHRFLEDFFMLVPSDRLKIEAVIAQLNYNYDLHVTKVRPNTIKTRAGSLLEYPFGERNVGRIYFIRNNGKIHYYRISRTKNGRGKLDQKRVIMWLQKNLSEIK